MFQEKRCEERVVGCCRGVERSFAGAVGCWLGGIGAAGNEDSCCGDGAGFDSVEEGSVAVYVMAAA